MVSSETMTIQIPDDLERGLEGIAAAQLQVCDPISPALPGGPNWR
jgi:hypothetical protein